MNQVFSDTITEVEKIAIAQVGEKLALAMQDRRKWDKIQELLSNPNTPDGVFAILQAAVIPMPKGDITLPDGRTLHRVMGYHAGKQKIINRTFKKAEEREGMRDARAWSHASGLLISASYDDGDHGEILHVAMSYKHRDPTWEEIKMARHVFFPPFVDVIMVLPKYQDYVNIHPHCFHINQCPAVWGSM